MQPTTETYTELDRAYAYFNRELFGDRLPPCIITMQRKKGANGYFWADTWAKCGEATDRVDEIALNPDTFQYRTVTEVLSTLVHEMVHLKQQHFGKPSRNAYHNKEWGTMMEDVGLIPTDTGKPGGKRTGQKVTHYVEPGGRFEASCKALIDTGFVLPWLALTTSDASEKKRAKKAASKTKYTCPSCEANAWAKPDASLVCGDCMEHMQDQG